MIPLRIIGQDPPVRPRNSQPTGFNLWGYGFRPFFLLGSATSSVLLAVWLFSLASIRNLSPGLSGPLWHAHEMYFGFTVAIVAGFLLTAVPNWTGIPTPRGRPLAALTLTWLLGRLASWQGSEMAWVDLAFLPLLATVLSGPLVRARKLNNLVFLPVLGWLTLANGVFWWGIQNQQLEVSRNALSATLFAILTLIAVIGGRVIPFFTEKAIDGYRSQKWPMLEVACGISLLVAAGVELLPDLTSSSRAALLLGLAALHLIRWLRWWHAKVVSVPLLWVLYAGYAFLPLGLSMKALVWLGMGTPTAATHALTAGCIGVMCLGMMARVALGHSGRPLKPHPIIVGSFWLICLAGGVRSLIPFFWPQHSWSAWWLAGTLWCLAFGLYAGIYAPILTSPRADGKPG